MKTVLCLAVLIVVAASSALPQKDSAVSCGMCRIAVNAATKPVDNEVHTVEDEFDAECKKEFGSIGFLEKECENYANSKLDPIIKELEGGTAPEDVCTKLKEC